MYLKDISLQNKEGWQEYFKRSWILIPKINGRALDSLVLYSGLGAFVYLVIANGGFVESSKLLRQIAYN